MRSQRASSVLLCVVLAFAATAAYAATNEAAPPVAPAAAALSLPAWNPAILSDLQTPDLQTSGLQTPVQAKSESPLPFLQPAFCPPSCLGCSPPFHCTAPCQTHFGCTICSCHS